MAHETRVLSEKEQCPNCNELMLKQTVTVYRERHSEEEILLFTTICEGCNFKRSSTMGVAPSKFAGSEEIEINIGSSSGLATKIYRSPTASISFPDLEMEMEPGIAAEFSISNVESFLLKFKDSCGFILKDESDPSKIKVIQEKIAAIDELLEGKRQFMINIIDPERFSYVVPEGDVSVIKVKKKETSG